MPSPPQSDNNITDSDILTISSSNSDFLGFANELDEEYYDTTQTTYITSDKNSSKGSHNRPTDTAPILVVSDSESSNLHELTNRKSSNMTSLEKVKNWKIFPTNYGNCTTHSAPASLLKNDVASQKHESRSSPLLNSESTNSERASSSMIQIRNTYMVKPKSVAIPLASKSMIKVRQTYFEMPGEPVKVDAKVDLSISSSSSSNNQNSNNHKEELYQYLRIDTTPYHERNLNSDLNNKSRRRSKRVRIDKSKVENGLHSPSPTDKNTIVTSNNNLRKNTLMKMKTPKTDAPSTSILAKYQLSNLKIETKDYFKIDRDSENESDTETVPETKITLKTENVIVDNKAKMVDVGDIKPMAKIEPKEEKPEEDLSQLIKYDCPDKSAKEVRINGENRIEKSYKIKQPNKLHDINSTLTHKGGGRLIRSKTRRVPLRNGKYRASVAKRRFCIRDLKLSKVGVSSQNSSVPKHIVSNLKPFVNGTDASKIHNNLFAPDKMRSFKPPTIIDPPSTLILSPPAPEPVQLVLNTMKNPLLPKDGVVLKAFYDRNYLIIVQEKTISFWFYSRISRILGISQTWELVGKVNRLCNDSHITNQSGSLCSRLNEPVYVEFLGNELLHKNCLSPMSSVYINLYSVYSFTHNKLEIKKVQNNSIQLDSVWSFLKDICCSVIPQSNTLFISWYQKTEQASQTGLCKYVLTPDVETLSSIKTIDNITHKLISLLNLNDLRLIGFGETQVSVWDIYSGDQLLSLDLKTPLGENMNCVACRDEEGEFLLCIQLLDSCDDEKLVKVFCINVKQNRWHTLDHFSNLKINQKVSLSSTSTQDLLVNTFENGEIFVISLNTFQLLHKSSNTTNALINISKQLFAHDNYIITINTRNLTVQTIFEYIVGVYNTK